MDRSLYERCKASLLHRLEENIPFSDLQSLADTVQIFGIMAITQQISASVNTFGDVSNYILNQVMKYPAPKIFFVTYQYNRQSIKSFEREKRAITGVIRVTGSRTDQPRLKQLNKYLLHGANKIEFVQCLLKDWKLQLLRYHNFQYHDLYVTCQDKCYCLTLVDDTVRERETPKLSTLHEETDTKVFTCIKYVNESGFDKAVVHTVDTDVVVLGLYYQAFIDCEIFIHLGCGSKKRLLELKNAELSRELCVALPGPHALTGCDSTSFIHRIGKEKAYKIFEQNEVYTDALSLLGEFEVVPPNVIDLLE